MLFLEEDSSPVSLTPVCRPSVSSQVSLFLSSNWLNALISAEQVQLCTQVTDLCRWRLPAGAKKKTHQGVRPLCPIIADRTASFFFSIFSVNCWFSICMEWWMTEKRKTSLVIDFTSEYCVFYMVFFFNNYSYNTSQFYTGNHFTPRIFLKSMFCNRLHVSSPHTADWSPGWLLLRRGEHWCLQQLPDFPAAPEADGEGLLPILPGKSCTLRLAFSLMGPLSCFCSFTQNRVASSRLLNSRWGGPSGSPVQENKSAVSLQLTVAQYQLSYWFPVMSVDYTHIYAHIHTGLTPVFCTKAITI